MSALAGLNIAILIANGFTENEFADIQRALIKAGAKSKTIAPEKGMANGWLENGWGHYFPVDQQLGDTLASDFDALIMVGGSRAIAKLAQNPHTARIVGHFFAANKPFAALNEAVGLLTQPGKLEGRTIAADQTDPAIGASGAKMCSDPMAVDGNLLTIQSHDVNEEIAAIMAHFERKEALAAA
jgi:protease I